ncbi:MAG: hypothetical protein LBH43_20940 [Treponema sp.]|nr:hypothetical protein [Treponema sp.]
MTDTTQPDSGVLIDETGKDLSEEKDEAEDNLSLLISVGDSLNNLYRALSRLDDALKRKLIGN